MNFEIRIYRGADELRPILERSGVWSASNVHTAVNRALTGYPMEHRKGDIAATGAPKDWTTLAVGESVKITVRRL